MADQTNVLDFSVELDYSVTPAKLRLTDTSTYGPGVAADITGKVEVTQPDQITTPGAFTDVVYSGGQLTVAEKELRLGTNGHPQNGNYSITYTVNHNGDISTRTKVFALSYTEPRLSITKALDVFTPNLRCIDSSSYIHSGLTYVGIIRSWNATVGSVGSTSGSSATFDLAIGGEYYDAEYAVTLQSVVEWYLTSYSWVTIVDKITKEIEFTADTPPTLEEIGEMLEAYRLEVEALSTNCEEYDTKHSYYLSASALYQNLMERGRRGNLDGLEDYIEQIEKLLNDNITPSYTNTNEVIPPYDWETTGSGSVTWNSITGKPSSHLIQFKVGDLGYPANGATTFTDSRMLNCKVVVFRSGFLQWKDNPGDGDSYYSKTESGAGSDVLTVSPAFATGEKFLIITLPL